ncbi:MAG TPA: flavodoxin family protein [Tissierellaceae bacterium]
MKKILALMGSPRKGKNTDVLLGYLLDGINKEEYEIKKINLIDKKINHCTGCDYCGHVEGCVEKDDMYEIYEGFDTSDIIILAAPIYFNSINGLTKNMIDRCQRYWSLKYTLGKKYKNTEDRIGIFLAVGGAPFAFEQFSGSIPVVDYFFKAINVTYKGNYFVSNTDNLSVAERPEIRKELYEIGRNIENITDFYIQK